MMNFTVGPVQTYQEVKEIGAQDVPYFRTAEFSAVVLECERLLLQFLNAPADSRTLLLTGSGTFSMEATVSNVFTPSDKLLVVNGGSFGARFAEICRIHGIPHEEIRLAPGKALTAEQLACYEGKGFTGFLVNIHETSTGVLYDWHLIGDFCQRNGILLIIDAISSFLADPLDMSAAHADAILIGSQKALALAPGLSIAALSPRAVERIRASKTHSLYMDLKAALKDGERGQTPFTPAVGTILQLHARLKMIESKGLEATIAQTAALAADFRAKIAALPFDIFSESLSNAVTPLKTRGASATKIFETLKNEYNIWICPNGGPLKDEVFRVGHIGNLTVADNDALIAAFYDLVKRNILY